MLETFRLRVFREVALQGSFRRAAEVLYISQPAVTQQMKALEGQLGQRLLDRSGGRVRPTAAGNILLAGAKASEALLRKTEEELAALSGEVRGSVEVAASTTIAQYILPRLLASFSRRYPEVALSLESANTERTVQRVEEGLAVLGLVEGPVHRSAIHVEPWIADELVLVVPAAHEWAGQEIAMSELRTAALLVREQGSGSLAVLEAAFGEHGLSLENLHVAMRLGSTEALLACIEAGLGVGFASRFALRRQRKLGTLAITQVQGLRVTRTLSLLRQHGPEPTGVVASLREFLLQYARTRRQTVANPLITETYPP